MSRRPRRARTTRSCSICTKARTRSTGRGALDSPPDEIESRHVVSSRVDAVSILGRFAAASLPSKALRAPAACRAGVVTMRSCRAGLGHSLPRTRKRCTDQQLEIRPVDPRECLLDIARSLGFPEAEAGQRLLRLRHDDDALELRTPHRGRRSCDARLKSRCTERLACIRRIDRRRDRERRGRRRGRRRR